MIGRSFFLLVILIGGFFLWKSDFDLASLMGNLQGSAMSLFGEDTDSKKEALEEKMKGLGIKLADLGESLIQKKAQGEEKIEETVQAIQITQNAFQETQKALESLGSVAVTNDSVSRVQNFQNPGYSDEDNQNTKQVLAETQKEFARTKEALEKTQKELEEMKGVLKNINGGGGSIFSFFSSEKGDEKVVSDESLEEVKNELEQLKEVLQGLQNSMGGSGAVLEDLEGGCE